MAADPKPDKPKPDKRDIHAKEVTEVMWDRTDPIASLRAVRTNVEDETLKTIGWYWNNKQLKSYLSRIVQFSSLVLAAAAGLLPAIIQAGKSFKWIDNTALPDTGSIATLCLGLAASLIGLDKTFGFSSGWTRYVLTATAMTKLLQEFRLDWVALVTASADPPTLEQQAKLIQRAKDLISAIQAMLLQETKDWATEFQNNTAQMEKDLKTQLDTLKAQVDKTIKEKEDAAKPAAIELTVTNADKTDGFRFEVTLESASSKFTDAAANSKVWTRINTPPGQYKLAIEARVQGAIVGTSMILDVKPAETAKASLTLPIA